MSYERNLHALINPSFSAIRNIASDELSHLSRFQRDKLWEELDRGTALLQTHEQMCQYLFSYGNMHQAKLMDAFQQLPSVAYERQIEIIDWGCGQAMGTINFIDFLNEKDATSNIKKITLIEPSAVALERARIHVNSLVDASVELITIPHFFEDITADEISSNSERIVIHIFSNILDVAQIDLKHLANLIDNTVISDNFLVCVGPLNPTNQRIDAFFRYFDDDLIDNLYEFEETNFKNRNWTYKGRIYKLERNERGHLIPIEYYPTVQFHSAYELDMLRNNRGQKQIEFSSNLQSFEVAVPFDLGASVYDDVHPVLAVLNNIICRGLPTKTSVYIEEQFQSAFELTQRDIKYGEIKFNLKPDSEFDIDFEIFEKYLDNELEIDSADLVQLQLLFTPIAIARFQKVIVEAIITGHLPMDTGSWKILVEEKDVPFANLAIEDFKSTFDNLIQLSEEYNDYRLPEIELFVISNNSFFESKLHCRKVYRNTTNELRSMAFDMVVTHAILKTTSIDIESFSEYTVKNNCYFNIRSIESKRTARGIYTSNVIKYKNLVEKTSQGVFIENARAKENLTYFLQLFFRKDAFRAGQLPILDRALQNLPVIGLLPTGGGKSLTYQISALLQPGITMVIDPLKSLMKDQYDGLISSGIDCVTYLNSSLTTSERKSRERQLESSQVQIIFLSPERLAIASFRERLKNMHDYNVYFSYGVIDEVHCVSEWGHDFRFSYLHLGRNLYNYVKGKDKEISLFGLTATASFDVLADVERELSGNGSFVLDADVIVRYENTNRLELQYKVEKVEVDFEDDGFFDPNHQLAPHLAKALNITNHWKAFDSKSNFLKDYTKKIPDYLNEIQSVANVDYIKSRFVERQNNDEGIDANLQIPITSDYYAEKEVYEEAGIVFCPHVQGTGLSVQVNTTNLRQEGFTDVASFSGRDNDNLSMANLETFRKNGSPLMVATKAFGMGIDKPNVRFTVNMNYSSSLESFVQEAGRAGRDKKIALSTILVSDYSLAQVSRKYLSPVFPIPLIKGKWFRKEDLKEILSHYAITVPEQFWQYATPNKDIVKLFCPKDNVMFGFNNCSEVCTEFTRCNLRKATNESRGWKSEVELIQDLKAKNLNLSKKYFQYLNADYQTVMYFFNESFKGDNIEKRFMHQLLNTNQLFIETKDGESTTLTEKTGFLSTVLSASIDEEIVVFIPYNETNSTDLSKAIYRMVCIELIEDFTQNYSTRQFRIVTKRKELGQYYQGLKRFLLRYYTDERADAELVKVTEIVLKSEDIDELSKEIYKCLAYLTEFVYDKISEKRKRAIDDMRNFCMEGVDESVTWVERNESLKDFIYYYFNSKYAKSDYVADNGEAFSLVIDTDGGKISSEEILFKYTRVIDDDIVGVGTPLDNIKHLYGAVRLISRSLTDSNPALYLLEVFCLAYMGMKNNKGLQEQLVSRYSEGMTEFSSRMDSQESFWTLFKSFNTFIKSHIKKNDLKTLIDETTFLIHANQLRTIKNKYLEINE
ncbi:DEAD/DEAH box helicase [Flavobacterium tegetincola]|uniref:DEAD/DEAH box helicase n=1 Tax=Flavobacterium tegetincola TaxID=150172 RepID=UPI0003F6FF15